MQERQDRSTRRWHAGCSRCASRTTSRSPTRADPDRRPRGWSTSTPARSRSAAEVRSASPGPTQPRRPRCSRARSSRSSPSSPPPACDAGRAATTSRTLLHRTRTQRDVPEHDVADASRGRSLQRGVQAGQVEHVGRCTTSSSRATRPTGSSSGGSRSASTARSSSWTSKLAFRAGTRSDGDADHAPLGQALLTFRPARDRRAAGRRGHRPWLGPDSKATVFEATANAGSDRLRDRHRPRRHCGRRFGGGTVPVADRPVLSSDEAQAARQEPRSPTSPTPRSRPRASCQGDPRLAAGDKVKIEGIGTRFGGTYCVSSSTHVYRGTAATRRLPRSPAARRAASST